MIKASLNYNYFLVLVLMIAALISGCANAAQEYADGKPYSAEGWASFYGHNDGFNGKRMANGKRFNTNNPHLAAHPFLPLGTKLKVVNLSNHRVLYVKVTDRMEKIHGRIIDLSYAGAKHLGIKQSKGLAKVKVISITNEQYDSHI